MYEEALEDELVQIFLEVPAVYDLVPLTVLVGTILFCFGKCRIILDWSRALDAQLVLDGAENLIDGELEQSEVLFQLESLERTQ